MEQLRVFIAIELSEEITAYLARLQSELRKEPFVKWVDPRGIHLTLKFLGNVASERVPEIARAVELACEGVAPFELSIGGPGAFPNLNAPRVVWVGAGGEVEKCAILKRRIDEEFVPLGFAAEGRAFVPHLTLGRVRESASAGERRRLGEAIKALEAGSRPSLLVSSVSLMRSRLTPAGALYSRLSVVDLG